VTDLELHRVNQYDESGADPMENKPDFVTNLETAYGAPSQAAFGSAVFYEVLPADADLTQAALVKYRYFVGRLWEQYGEKAWMGPWREVYVRQPGTPADIVSELRGITDRDAQLSIPMILDNIEGAEKAQAALAAAYNDSAVNDLRVFNLGDGEAMSGLLIAGRCSDGATTTLTFLLD
jgi:hypothetical protein